MKQFSFEGLIILDNTDFAPSVSQTDGLIVRAVRIQPPWDDRYFPAVIETDGGEPLKPGEPGHVVTIAVTGDEPKAFFGPGQHFAVWNGCEIGHGVVYRPCVS